MFKKGNKFGQLGGRPKGSKDQVWTSLRYWFDKLEGELSRTIHYKEYSKSGAFVREWDDFAVKPDTRARIFLEGMKMLVSKMAQLPANSGESVANATALMADLKELEKQFDIGTKSGSNMDGVDVRPTEIQIETNPAPNTGSVGEKQNP